MMRRRAICPRGPTPVRQRGQNRTRGLGETRGSGIDFAHPTIRGVRWANRPHGRHDRMMRRRRFAHAVRRRSDSVSKIVREVWARRAVRASILPTLRFGVCRVGKTREQSVIG